MDADAVNETGYIFASQVRRSRISRRLSSDTDVCNLGPEPDALEAALESARLQGSAQQP